MPKHQRPPRRRFSLPSRTALIIAAVACVVLGGGGFAAARYLGDDHPSGTGAASADDAVHGRGNDSSRSAGAEPSASVATSRTAAKQGGGHSTPAHTPSSAPSASAPASTAPPTSSQCTDPQFSTSNPTGGWSDGNYYLYNDMWNISGYSVSQTLYACSYNNWYVVATMNNDSGDGAVKTYPDVQANFNEPAISSFHTITSTFAETSPHVGIYEDAYDIWINGVATSGSTEVMVWTENFHQVPCCTDEGTFTFSGRSFVVWKNGNYFAIVATTNFTSGTMNLLQIFDWIMSKGWMPSTSTLGSIQYGVEIVSTNSAPATFSFTNFSVTTS